MVTYQTGKLCPPRHSVGWVCQLMAAVCTGRRTIDWLCQSTIACVPSASSVHTNPYLGHYGVQRTHHALQEVFYWPDSRSAVEKCIRSCDVTPAGTVLILIDTVVITTAFPALSLMETYTSGRHSGVSFVRICASLYACRRACIPKRIANCAHESDVRGHSVSLR